MCFASFEFVDAKLAILPNNEVDLPAILDDAELQRSHVIPEFFYEYDELHRVLTIEGRRERPRLDQKGTRFPLLCFDCEQFVNDTFEKPMREMWVARQALPSPLIGDAVHISGLDYAKFKLFHLSVLWRALAAGYRDEMQDIQNEAEHLRAMLLNQDPGRAVEYPVVMAPLRLAKTGQPASGTIMLPQPSIIREQLVYCSVFGGCQWFYVISRTGLPERDLQEWALSEKGTLIGIVRDLRAVEEIDALLSKYERNAREQNWPNPWRRKRGG